MPRPRPSERLQRAASEPSSKTRTWLLVKTPSKSRTRRRIFLRRLRRAGLGLELGGMAGRERSRFNAEDAEGAEDEKRGLELLRVLCVLCVEMASDVGDGGPGFRALRPLAQSLAARQYAAGF